MEVKKNGPIYRLFNSLVHPKQEDSSNIKAPPIPVQSSSLRNQSGQISRLPNPSDKVVADPNTALNVAYGQGSFYCSEHMDVQLPHLELDFPAGNSVGLSGIQLQKPQPTMSVILSPVFPIILPNRRFHRDCHGNTIGFNRLGLIPSRLSIAISDCHTDRGKGQGWWSHISMLGLSFIYNSLNKYL